jgi:hypothetical protein
MARERQNAIYKRTNPTNKFTENWRGNAITVTAVMLFCDVCDVVCDFACTASAAHQSP